MLGPCMPYAECGGRGDWHFGKKQGRGRYTRSDGTVYEGEYVADRKEGQGRCVCMHMRAWIVQGRQEQSRVCPMPQPAWAGRARARPLTHGVLMNANGAWQV